MSVTHIRIPGLDDPPHGLADTLQKLKTRAASALAFGSVLVGRIGKLMARALWEHRVRRAARDLARLDDRTLRDIGISRSEIESVVRYGRARDTAAVGAAFGYRPVGDC